MYEIPYTLLHCRVVDGKLAPPPGYANEEDWLLEHQQSYKYNLFKDPARRSTIVK